MVKCKGQYYFHLKWQDTKICRSPRILDRPLLVEFVCTMDFKFKSLPYWKNMSRLFPPNFKGNKVIKHIKKNLQCIVNKLIGFLVYFNP